MDKIRISVSLGSVLDTKKLDDIYYSEGKEEFNKKLRKINNNNELLRVGPSLGLINYLSDIKNVELVLISKFSADSELMMTIAQSINKYLQGEHGFNNFQQTIFSDGEDIVRIHKELKIDLAITTNNITLKELIAAGIPSIQIKNISHEQNLENYERSKNGITIISDFDGVIADSSSEEVFQNAIKEGDENPVETFLRHESDKIVLPMKRGPLVSLIKIIAANKNSNNELHIVTARNGSVSERVILTLKEFEINANQFWFMAGYNKNIAIENIISKDNNNLILFLDDGKAHFERSNNITRVVSALVGSELFLKSEQ